MSVQAALTEQTVKNIMGFACLSSKGVRRGCAGWVVKVHLQTVPASSVGLC